MHDSEIRTSCVIDMPLTVEVVEDEIVVAGLNSLTLQAARETAQRLLIAVAFLEAQRRFKSK